MAAKASGRTVVIRIVVTGAAADGLLSVWPDASEVHDGLIPPRFVQRMEEALYQTVPSSVSRTMVKRGMKVRADYLAATTAGVA